MAPAKEILGAPGGIAGTSDDDMSFILSDVSWVCHLSRARLGLCGEPENLPASPSRTLTMIVAHIKPGKHVGQSPQNNPCFVNTAIMPTFWPARSPRHQSYVISEAFLR